MKKMAIAFVSMLLMVFSFAAYAEDSALSFECEIAQHDAMPVTAEPESASIVAEVLRISPADENASETITYTHTLYHSDMVVSGGYPANTSIERYDKRVALLA